MKTLVLGINLKPLFEAILYSNCIIFNIILMGPFEHIFEIYSERIMSVSTKLLTKHAVRFRSFIKLLMQAFCLKG